MIFKIAYKNLFRNRRRSFSTGLAICIGFVALNLLGGYIVRVRRALELTSVYPAMKGHYIIYKKDSVENFQSDMNKYLIQKEEQQKIFQKLQLLNDDIEYTGQQLSTTALLSNGKKSHPVFVFGFDPKAYARSLRQEELYIWAADWILPSQKNFEEQYEKNNDVISLTPLIYEIMGISDSNKNESGTNDFQLAARNMYKDLNAVNADASAQHTTGLQYLEDTVIMAPLKKTQELLSTEGIESISIFLKPTTGFAAFKNKIKNALKDLPFELDIYNYQDEAINPMFAGTMGFLYVMAGFFIFLICGAVSLTIINSLTMGIIERTREIGTLRAIGFNAGHIQKIFVLEALLLSCLSMALGTVLSFLISKIINAAHIQFFPPGGTGKIQFILAWNMALGLTVFSGLLFVSWLASYIVIRKKNKVKLVHLLNDIGE